MGTIHSNSRGGCGQGQIFSRRSSRENQKGSNQHNPLAEKISSESRSDVPSQLSPSPFGDHSPGMLSSDSECPSPREERADESAAKARAASSEKSAEEQTVESYPVKAPDSSTVKEPDCSVVKEPDISIVKEPDCSIVKEPDSSTVKEPDCSIVKEPDSSTVKEPDYSIVKAPDSSSVKEPDCSIGKALGSSTVKEPDSSIVKEPDCSIVKEPDCSTEKELDCSIVKEPDCSNVKAPDCSTEKELDCSIVKEPDSSNVKAPDCSTEKELDCSIVKEPDSSNVKAPDCSTEKELDCSIVKEPDSSNVKAPDCSTVTTPYSSATKSPDPSTVKAQQDISGNHQLAAEGGSTEQNNRKQTVEETPAMPNEEEKHLHEKDEKEKKQIQKKREDEKEKNKTDEKVKNDKGENENDAMETDKKANEVRDREEEQNGHTKVEAAVHERAATLVVSDGQRPEKGETTQSAGENASPDNVETQRKQSQRPVVRIELVKTPSEEYQLQGKPEDSPLQDGEITPENDVEQNLSPLLSSEDVTSGGAVPRQSRSSPNLTVSGGRPGGTSPSPSASSHGSRFSFFRGIQNVIHANRWIKKTHGNSSKSEKADDASTKEEEKKDDSGRISPDTLRDFEETMEKQPPELTDPQKELLRKSWQEIGQDISQVGIIAFTGLFDSHPDIQDTFLPFQGLSSSELANSAMLREHALRVMTTVEKFVHRVDHPDKMRAILEEVGRKHFQYKIKVEYLNMVGNQFVRAVQPHVSKWTSELEDAWGALVSIMTFHIARGILDTYEEKLAETTKT